ncbi:hypothetical protein JOD43_002505 [Pullulanibacillus pueri]|nr:hypothetical protein [Pullulanibacillus pueri]
MWDGVIIDDHLFIDSYVFSDRECLFYVNVWAETKEMADGNGITLFSLYILAFVLAADFNCFFYYWSLYKTILV